MLHPWRDGLSWLVSTVSMLKCMISFIPTWRLISIIMQMQNCSVSTYFQVTMTLVTVIIFYWWLPSICLIYGLELVLRWLWLGLLVLATYTSGSKVSGAYLLSKQTTIPKLVNQMRGSGGPMHDDHPPLEDCVLLDVLDCRVEEGEIQQASGLTYLFIAWCSCTGDLFLYFWTPGSRGLNLED